MPSQSASGHGAHIKTTKLSHLGESLQSCVKTTDYQKLAPIEVDRHNNNSTQVKAKISARILFLQECRGSPRLI